MAMVLIKTVLHLLKKVPLIAVLLILGCSFIPSHDERVNAAKAIAAEAGWQRFELELTGFRLFGFAPVVDSASVVTDVLTVYIEGDGLAWISRTRPSSNPTPTDAQALRLAVRHQGVAVYLARPCQFVAQAGCDSRYWLGKRFASEVVAANNEAVDVLKQRFKAQRIQLVGYSGGAAIAAMVAARRDDVVRLVSVAGNMHPDAWTQQLGLTKLGGDSPVNYVARLHTVPQLLLVGGQDKQVPPAVADAYMALFDKAAPISKRVKPSFDHGCCWAEAWPGVMD